MNMATSLATRPLSEAQWQALQPLLRQLDSRQSLWLSGYLAARAEPAESLPLAANAAPPASILIAYGSETGNSEALAWQLAAQATARGIAHDIGNLATVRLRQLAKYQYLLLICSTHGDGDPPEPITAFHTALMEPRAARLPELAYAVLALGDSSYAQFCRTGQEFDERLAALGARALLPRQDCDVDYAEPARHWMSAALDALPQAGASAATVVATATTVAPVASAAQSYSKQRPLTVEVLNNVRLSAPQRRSATHHLELALDVPLPLQAGDAVGVLADNPPALVAAILDVLQLSAEQAVTLDGNAMPLVQALRQQRNLNVCSPRFLEAWATLSGSEELAGIVADSAAQKAFLRSHQLRDIAARYPAHPEPQALVDLLRPMQPRLYDLANSFDAVADELHLTVQHYRYAFGSREESGIASEYLVQLQPGDSLRLYPHRHARFQLPEDPQLPLILIAEGTGIAPYRAFIQHLRASGQHRRCWLLFAEQQFEQDFLYQRDWQQAQADGLLQHIDTVFYQDEPGRNLADLALADANRLRQWLDDGAHLYLCGDTVNLEACEQALQQHYDAQRDASARSWEQLSKDKRIHRNLY